jgi:hypothetical protein
MSLSDETSSAAQRDKANLVGGLEHGHNPHRFVLVDP